MTPAMSRKRIDTLNDHYLLARLVRDVEGPLAKLTSGAIVEVRDIDRGTCTITRIPPRAFPATIIGVPTSALDFDV